MGDSEYAVAAEGVVPGDLPRSVLDHLIEGCQVLDRNFRYRYVNDAVARHGRTSREALLGRTMMEAYPGIENTELFAILRRCMDEGSAARLETAFVFADGSQGWFELRIQPVPVGLVVLSMEITDRKRDEAQLRESQRLAAVGTTASMFAHEVGNPLNSLHLQIERLERQLRHSGVGEGVREPLRRMQDEIGRLDRLLDDFRAGERDPQLALQPTDLATCLRELMRLHVEPLAGPRLQIIADIPRDLPPVSADADKLVQVFVNLCKNAVEAMPEGGTLTIRATPGRDHVGVEIADTGTGIPEDRDVFELWQTTKESGMGLGLAIVQQILEAHGATIHYESKRNVGTTFYVMLPTSEHGRWGLRSPG